jgi:hypothetical protein
MSSGPSGRDDPASCLAASGRYDEQDVTDSHADDSCAFFAVVVTGVDFLNPVRVLNGGNGSREVDTVPTPILCGFRRVPFEFHRTEGTGYP